MPRPSTALVGTTAIPLRGIAKRPRQRSPLVGNENQEMGAGGAEEFTWA